MFAQLGNSIGLAVTAAVAASVSVHYEGLGRGETEIRTEGGVLPEGYKAAFWICAASMVLVTGVPWWGLRSGGKVGRKSD